ncbi:MAG TPA: ATP-binding protein [Acidimicrobiales bacterium]|nr:ATP-binding protein [Acidimicrobiales bacterium]
MADASPLQRPAAPRAESSAHLAVLDASPNPIVGVDASGAITYANPQALQAFGYEEAELLGQPVELLLPERSAERHREHRAAFTDNPHARPMGIGLDLWARRRDGRELPVEISLSPLAGDPAGTVFATVVDISARKAAEAQLLQAQKLESVGRLAGGIAHDFGNMVFAIRGFVDLLEEDLSGDPADLDVATMLQNVRGIDEAATRAGALTAQLLAFSRQQSVAPRVVEPAGSIRALQPLLERLIGESVELRLTLAPDTGRIRADPGQLDQILVNLAVNARDAMPEGGRITVETSNITFDEAYAADHFNVSAGDFVLVAVSDTGVGMDAATRARVFEPFFTTKELGRGTGLGLATIYGIVQQAGGHIWLYSEPGRGSTFKLYFPRVDAEEPMDAAPRPLRRSRGTVLLAEDEATVRQMTRQVLRRAGWNVIEASSGGEALQLLESMRQPVDAVVSDVVMPGTGGIALADAVLDRSPGTRVVLLSGYTAEALDLERVMARGARFVSKPASRRDLLAALDDEPGAAPEAPS